MKKRVLSLICIVLCCAMLLLFGCENGKPVTSDTETNAVTEPEIPGEVYVFDDGINNATYSEERTFELKNPTTYVGSDGKPIGPSGGIGWNKIPSTPIVKNLDATVNGTSLEVDYDAEVR